MKIEGRGKKKRTRRRSFSVHAFALSPVVPWSFHVPEQHPKLSHRFRNPLHLLLHVPSHAPLHAGQPLLVIAYGGVVTGLSVGRDEGNVAVGGEGGEGGGGG